MCVNQILVEVFCPATSKTYDFWIPKKMLVGSAVEKLSEEICAFESNERLFGPRDEVLLCSRGTRMTLPRNDSLEACGVKSGDKLAIL